MFRFCLCLVREYLWSKFQQTCAIFRGERVQKPSPPSPQTGGFTDAASPQKHLKIYNLSATNVKLMKLIMSIYLHKKLNLAEDWGVTHRVSEGVKQKSLKLSQKNGFLTQFQVFCKNKIKTITCLMHYVTLHHWSKFETNLTTFQWVTFKKPPRSSLKLYLLLKTFEISKLDNYKSDISETWPIYVPAEYL